ncbi:MAG TPA: glycosyltransferase 87 family protein [Candidatus Dormibacteraeota bacterium]|jgi:hypothetical protein|nr:glycosyltransferase 87 family protein [Candidatus Dormibacteraeota bacterium]
MSSLSEARPGRGVRTFPWRGTDLVVLVILVVALVAVTSWPLSSLLPFNPELRGDDFARFWRGSHALLTGAQDFPYQPGFGDFFYPAPYLVLSLPFSLLPAEWSGHLARALTAVLSLGVVGAWASTDRRVPISAWFLAASLPVVTAVFLGQLPTLVGVAAFSLAIWAQRQDRWWLVGVAVAIGLVRPANALPVLAMLVVGGWRRPRGLLTAAATTAAVLAPLSLVVTVWDPHWVPDYLRTVGEYRFGLPAVLGKSFGAAGVVLPQLVAVALAVYWNRREAGRPLDLDRSAAVMALSVLVAPFTSAYSAMFALPAVIRLSRRPGMWVVCPAFALLPWLGLLAGIGDSPLSFYILGPSLVGVFVLATLPMLLRRRNRV